MNPSAWCSAVSRPFSAVALDASPTTPCGLRSEAIQAKACVPVWRSSSNSCSARCDARGEVLGLGHVDEVGPEMQHHRRLEVAAMDAVAVLDLAVEPVRPAEARPARLHRQHA